MWSIKYVCQVTSRVSSGWKEITRTCSPFCAATIHCVVPPCPSSFSNSGSRARTLTGRVRLRSHNGKQSHTVNTPHCSHGTPSIFPPDRCITQILAASHVYQSDLCSVFPHLTETNLELHIHILPTRPHVIHMPAPAHRGL